MKICPLKINLLYSVCSAIYQSNHCICHDNTRIFTSSASHDLSLQDKYSMMRLLEVLDKANGYFFSESTSATDDASGMGEQLPMLYPLLYVIANTHMHTHTHALALAHAYKHTCTRTQTHTITPKLSTTQSVPSFILAWLYVWQL